MGETATGLPMLSCNNPLRVGQYVFSKTLAALSPLPASSVLSGQQACFFSNPQSGNGLLMTGGYILHHP